MSEKSNIERFAVFGALAFLLVGCTMIMLPFFSALLWAAIVVFVTRKPYEAFNRRIGGHPWLVSILFVCLLIFLVILPIILGAINFSGDIANLVHIIKAQIAAGSMELPEWIVQAPYVGAKISDWWDRLIAKDPVVQEQLKNLSLWGAKHIFHFGLFTIKGIGLLILGCITAIFFYVGQLELTQMLHSAMERLSGARAKILLRVAGDTVFGVVVGILGTAVAQGVLMGFGLYIAGIPAAVGLTLVCIILSLFPAGAALVWIPSAFWLYHQGDIGWTWFVVIWGILIVGSADNVIKPLLIGHNSNLPFLLIVLGVLGGALNWGILGVFLGPVFLALGYALMREWLLNESLTRQQAAVTQEQIDAYNKKKNR